MKINLFVFLFMHQALALHQEIINGNIIGIEELLKNTDINFQDKAGRTALMLASINGNEEIVGILLTHRANVEAKNNLGKSALQLASIWGRAKVALILLKHGASIFAQPGQAP